jgi:hypothetical protein
MMQDQSLIDAVQRYFDLIHDADVSRFDRVFRSTAQLHGHWDGQLKLLSAEAFKASIAANPSPRSLGAPREDAILLVDRASDDQALVKVRVRNYAAVFVDYLTFHRTDGEWRITSKGFHVERKLPAAT